MLLVIFFIGCKKENKEKLTKEEKGVTVKDAKAFLANLSDLKTDSENGSGFNPKSLLEKIDWKNASQIDSGKTLIGKFDGAPTENGTKLGFRKAVFNHNSDGSLSLYILEFIPDIFHLWKYNGINNKSFDGKIIIYDQNYKLIHGYKLIAGKITGEILPAQQSLLKVDSDIKNDIAITTCTSESYVYTNAQGMYEAGIILSCQTEFLFISYNPNLQNEQVESELVDDMISSGGGVTEVPVPPMIIPGQENDPIDVKKFTKCFEVPHQLLDEYKFSLYVDQPVNGSTASSYAGNVGHTFIGITKISAGTTFTQYIGFIQRIV